MHDTYYRTVFEGGNIQENDWIVWIRNDYLDGDTGCQGAVALAQGTDKNDFVHGTDADDDPLHHDHGGLVRSDDLDGDGVFELFSDVQLLSDVDGRYDPDVHTDDDDDSLLGIEHLSSTYTLCWASGDFSGGPPTQDSQFLHVPLVKLHVSHLPPSPPPPSPPPPSPPPPSPPPPSSPFSSSASPAAPPPHVDGKVEHLAA